MEDKRVYVVTGSAAEPAAPIALADAGLKERGDLQEWVVAHPEMLGPDILVLTTEFDRWQAGGGARPLDRLDVLGLDSDGRLVVAELKRDRAPDTVEMQAIKYAAFASRFTEEALVEQYVRYLRRTRPDEETEAESAREALVSHAGELDPELLRRPRIVLVAGSFPPSVRATAVWLTEMGLDLSLQQVQAYRLSGGQVIVSVTQLYPLADVEEFTVAPARAEAQRTVRRRRERSAIVRLVESGALAEGTRLTLRPSDVSAEEREAIEEWVVADPAGKRATATWRNDRRGPVVWAADGKGYRPTTLARAILKQVGLDDRPLRGSAWWMTDDGSSLIDLAGLAAGGFDWSPLHAALAALGEGRWTTYGDLATAIGSGALAVGQHIAGCDQCPNAWRVLGADGTPRPGFRWGEGSSRTGSQQDALEEEGVSFLSGRAAPGRRVPLAELEAAAGDA